MSFRLYFQCALKYSPRASRSSGGVSASIVVSPRSSVPGWQVDTSVRTGHGLDTRHEGAISHNPYSIIIYIIPQWLLPSVVKSYLVGEATVDLLPTPLPACLRMCLRISENHY